MRWKILILSVLVLCGCKREDQSSARYEIRASIYEQETYVAGSQTGAINDRHGIFKIDRVTGKTWMYYNLIMLGRDSTNIAEGWKEVK